MNSNKVILGVLSGIAIGAFAGILLAPDKGTKTRKKIMKKSCDYTKDLKNKFGDLYNSVADKYNEVIEQAK
jgi:gas vesicle protein